MNSDRTAARDRDRWRRASGTRSVYDSARWRTLTRPYILARDPMCTLRVVCGGLLPSTEVDHIVRVQDGGDESDSNLRGVCHADHSRKTMLEQRGQWHEPIAVP